MPENTVPRPPLAEELVDKLRVLVPNEGLLSAGHVTPLSPPDIYGVVLDGEGKNKPRIYSREEILMESVSVLLHSLCAFLCAFCYSVLLFG